MSWLAWAVAAVLAVAALVLLLRRPGQGIEPARPAPPPAGPQPEASLDRGAPRVCPFCAETIEGPAQVCRFCGRDLPAA